MDSTEDNCNSPENTMQNSSEKANENGCPGSSCDATTSQQKAVNHEAKTGPPGDSGVENKSKNDVEMEDIGDDTSADETDPKTTAEPVTPEDIHLINNEGAVALTQDQISQMEQMQYMQQLALVQATGDPSGVKNMYNIANSPGAIVTEKFVKNTTIVYNETSRLSWLIENTKGRVEKFNLDEHYETQAIKSASNCLKLGSVFIQGPEKSGKTRTAFYLMKQNYPICTPIYISKSQDLQALSTVKDHIEEKLKTDKEKNQQTVFIICIDDLFSLNGDMRAYLQDVKELVDDGWVHLIVTSSEDIGNINRQADYAGILKDRYRIRLTDYPLDVHERYEILVCKSRFRRLKHRKGEVEGVKEEILQEIAKAANYPWFLCILDELEYLSPDPGPALVSFFRQPTRFLEKQIKEMYDKEKEKFIALVMIMQQGFLKERPLKSPDSPNPPDFTSLLGFQMPLTKIREAANEMVGEYLAYKDKCFVFIHESLTEIVCRVLFGVSPEYALRWCPLSFLVQRTGTMSGSDILLDETEQIELLQERFIKEVNIMEVLKHPGFSDPKFVKSIIKKLNIQAAQYKDILLQAIDRRQLALMKEITQNFLRTLPGGGDSIKPLALEKACEVGNFQAYDELLSVGAEPNYYCMKACKKGMNQQIISNIFAKFSSKFCMLSLDVIKDWILIIAEVEDINMLHELILSLQGRPDKSQLIAVVLERVIHLKDFDKYELIMRELEVTRTSYDLNKLTQAASEEGQDDILKDVLQRVDDLHILIDKSNLDYIDYLQDPFATACKFNQKGAAQILYSKVCGLSEGEVGDSLTTDQIAAGCRLLEMKTPEDQSTLHLAAGAGYNEDPAVLKWLLHLKKDWDPKAADIDGSTALHTACYAGNISAVDALLNRNFDPLAVSINGNTSLHTHLIGKFVNKPIVLKLLAKSDHQRKKEKHEKSVVCAQNKDGNTPLHLISMQQSPVYVSIVQTLVEANRKSVNIQNEMGQTPLHIFIESGGPSRGADILMENEFDLMKIDKDQQTALHMACLKTNEYVIKKMVKEIRKSPDILKQKNNNGWTPLHCYASTYGRKDTVQLLCSDNSTNVGDNIKQTALHLAVTVPGNSEVVHALIEKGAHVNAQDKWKQTALHVLCRQSHSTSCDLAGLLLKQGADINANDHNHQTPLHHTCCSEGPKSFELLDVLFSHGAMVLRKDINGITALHSCCLTCCDHSARVLESLLKHLKMTGQQENSDHVHQAITNADNHGDTPLHKVCLSQGEYKREVAKILIDEGADVSVTNNEGNTVIDISRRNGITDITQLLIEKTLISSCFDSKKMQNVISILSCELSPDVDNQERLSQMMQTVLQTDGPYTISVLEQLIGRGANVKQTTGEGYTVLHLAAMCQGEVTEHIIGYLISVGADVFKGDENGETALHKVSTGKTQNSSKLIKFLCSNGLSAKSSDTRGNTPLHTLFGFGKLNPYYKECMEELLNCNYEVDLLALNAQQKTPCDLARLHGKKLIGELFETYCTKRRVLNLKPLQHLIERGADINHMDSEGNTVLHRICMKRVTYVCNNVKLLIQSGADKTLYNNEGKSAFDLACETGLDEDVRELTVVEMPDDLDTDGASGASTPLYSRTPSFPISPQQALPRPEWMRRSSSTESWEGDLRSGMRGIRNAAGMAFFDNDMEEFEKMARDKQKNFFKHHM